MREEISQSDFQKRLSLNLSQIVGHEEMLLIAALGSFVPSQGRGGSVCCDGKLMFWDDSFVGAKCDTNASDLVAARYMEARCWKLRSSLDDLASLKNCCGTSSCETMEPFKTCWALIPTAYKPRNLVLVLPESLKCTKLELIETVVVLMTCGCLPGPVINYSLKWSRKGLDLSLRRKVKETYEIALFRSTSKGELSTNPTGLAMRISKFQQALKCNIQNLTQSSHSSIELHFINRKWFWI